MGARSTPVRTMRAVPAIIRRLPRMIPSAAGFQYTAASVGEVGPLNVSPPTCGSSRGAAHDHRQGASETASESAISSAPARRGRSLLVPKSMR